MQPPTSLDADVVDVVILGGGLAGLSLARHLLLDTDRTVLLLEKRAALPPDRQKVGESSVQLAGYYFSKVLDLESYLFHEHFMKYNLRFYWRTGEHAAGEHGSADGLENYSAAYIRPYSNIASYQLDRNTFEAELLRRNRSDRRFEARLGVDIHSVQLTEEGDDPHIVRYLDAEGIERLVRASWVVDTTGRRRLLAKQREMMRSNSIRHGAFFWWVDGLVDIEKLTGLSRKEWRLHPSHRHTGHLPQWLATNHFCDEGLWFWVIPLQVKTSLGLVFDHEVVHWRDVFRPDKATRFVCERFPMFARDLLHREVLDFGGYKDFSHDCVQTLSSQRWAMTGESGRFTDPLYSPGSDLIAIYNTLVVEAIQIDDPAERARFCQTSESLMKAVYQAYVPTYATSYDCLGDAECFSLKYTWELAIYFAVYVFPFINDLLGDRRFQIGFLRQFARLGPWNRGIQALLSDFYQWKKENRQPLDEPRFVDFMDIGTLRDAEKTFYEVGVEVDEAKRILAREVDRLSEMARFVVVHVASVVLDEPSVVTHRGFVEATDLATLDGDGPLFDPDAWASRWAACRDQPGTWEWSFDPEVLDRFRTARAEAPVLEAVS
ncbi:MAG: hypothetical protein AAGE94_03250 [Acidobacteriota bacterium]